MFVGGVSAEEKGKEDKVNYKEVICKVVKPGHITSNFVRVKSKEKILYLLL